MNSTLYGLHIFLFNYYSCLFYNITLSSIYSHNIDTLPKLSNSAITESPRVNAIVSDIAPLSTKSPFLSPLPKDPSSLTAHAIAYAGCSSIASLKPVCFSTPLLDITIPIRPTSIGSKEIHLLPIKNFADEQLSATVSTNVKRKSILRLSIITKGDATYLVALMTSSPMMSTTSKSLANRKTISGLTFR